MTQPEHPTVPLPEPARWVLAAETPRRRRRWPWVIGAVAIAVVLLLGVAVAIVETVVRSQVETRIADQVRTELALPEGHPVSVSIAGPLTPQLLVQNLGELTISSDDVPLGPITADVSVLAQDVSFGASSSMSGGEATVSLDANQLSSALTSVAGVELADVGVSDGAVTVGTSLSLFGVGVPLQLALVPSADAGAVVLAPDSVSLGGLSLTADQAREQFGEVADRVLTGWRICVAQYLPAGLELRDVSVDSTALVASFDVDGRILQDPALLEKGTCA